MDLGVSLPTSGPLASPAAILRVAQEAEQLGYRGLWTYERLLYALGDIPQPGGPPRPLPDAYRQTYEPIETLAFVAGHTSSAILGTSVLDAPFHNPVQLGKRLATLDQLSGGRVVAGFGHGWMDQEFATVGATKEHLVSRTTEFFAALRGVWGPDPVHFEGRFFTIPESNINPKPARAGGIPIVMGVFAPAALERAGRTADGLNPIGASPELLRGLVGQFRAAATAAGRDPAALPVYVRVNAQLTDAPVADGRQFLGGSPEQIAGDLAGIEDLGVTQVLFSDMHSADLDGHLARLARLQKAVGR
ncbi:MAG TPA: TIGR03619 family F420-dependent LLM class oxidoreductase [Actinomycetota bacterium]|nr:TIGR03619 family F420-dependent LLM class oxidoreductase [Actinomycetota bacterium]